MKKSTIIVISVLIVAVIAYFYYQGSKAPASQTLQSQPDLAAQAVGSQVLALLNQIQSLRIDTSIFKDPAYRTLRDYSVEIPAVPVGRSNPFAPLPGVPAKSATGR